MDEASVKELFASLYEQIRHNHERAVALTNSVSALVIAMEQAIPGFQQKYAVAFEAEVNSLRAEADLLVLGVIDGNIAKLRE